MRNVSTGSVNQSIVFHAFDADGAPVTLAHNAPGLSISYAIDVDGREGTPVALTPIARAVTGAHEDGAITWKGDGKHEVDLPDAAAATAGYVRLIVSATAVTGRVYSEVIAVGVLAVLDSSTSTKIDNILEDTSTTIPSLIEGISSGGTDWTPEQRTYILEQLALLTVSGASVVVTSGVYMCARGDVEQVYGNANTATWADLNNNQNSSEITSRINYHIVIADNYIRSVLTQGAWVMPVEGDTIPAILAYNCARLAGVLLYEGRGVTDYDPKGRAIHQLSNHKNGVDSFLKSVVYGSTDLSPLVKSSTNEAPTAS